MSAIGFIGTGTIGGPIAERLLDAGHALRVHDVDPKAGARCVEKGAERAASIRSIAESCATVFMSLPGPVQIREVMLGPDGLLAHAVDLRTVVDLSTNSIALNRDIAAQARAQQIHYFDAPVSGGRVAAVKGALSVMVGGDQAAFEGVRALVDCFAKHVFYLGEAGSGTLAKLVNNQIFLAASVLIQEGFVMGMKAGMAPAEILEVLKVSSAGSLVERAGLLLSRKFDADIFSLAIASKDIDVALESAQALGVEMPMTAAAAGIYHRALAADLGGEDFYATVKVLEAAAGVTLPPLPKPARG